MLRLELGNPSVHTGQYSVGLVCQGCFPKRPILRYILEGVNNTEKWTHTAGLEHREAPVLGEYWPSGEDAHSLSTCQD